MNRRLLVPLCVFVLSSATGCKEPSHETPEATAPSWTANISALDSTRLDANVEVKLAGANTFENWQGGRPIPAGATVRTPANVKATISIEDAEITLNHSSVIELKDVNVVVLTNGQALVQTRGGTTLELPLGSAALGAGKFAATVSEKQNSLTVTQGAATVDHEGASMTAHAGEELMLGVGTTPRLTQSPDLGRAISWSTLGEYETPDALPEVPRGLGKLVGKVPGGESEHCLDLINHRVDVKIQGNLAYTEITESFRNPVSQTLEGVYRFPLPPDARISRLSLKVGDKWMEGEFLETNHAERIWADIITQWRDPAMLKWKEGNTFELRIFPIDPHQTRVVKIGYVQRLEPSAGGYTYTYPMPMDRAGVIPAKKFEVRGELFGHDATQPLEVLGYAGKLEQGATEADRAVAKFTYDEDDFVARGDFSVRFGRPNAVGMRSYTYTEKGKDPFALFVMRPDLPARAETKPRDFVVVTDRSLSGDGAALQIQRQIVPKIIAEMDPLDRFVVVACNDRCIPVGNPSFQAPSLAAASDVKGALEALSAEGGTYPVEAVRVAGDLLRRREEAGREAHVVYFTDGVASIGELRPGPMADAVKRTLSPFDARMSIVTLGGNSDDLALTALAEAGNGRVVGLDPMLSASGQALQILSSHYREILAQPKLELPDGMTAAGPLPSAIAAGDELVIATRAKANTTGEIVLTGLVNGKPFRSAFPVSVKTDKTANTFVPGEWAAQRIEALELEPEPRKSEIVELSKTYGVLSRYTTLLALESNEMMDEFGVKRRQRTEWDGDQEAEEQAKGGPPSTTATAPSFDSELGLADEMNDVAKTAAPPAEKAKDSRPSAKPARATTKSASDDAFQDDLGSGRASFEPQRRPVPRSRAYYRPLRRILSVSNATQPTSWELQNAERRTELVNRDPRNRTNRMRAIRALIRAERTADAKRDVKEWLTMNPMDPEAIVQDAQLLALDGDIDAFYRRLITASDAAPRGRWLQDRIRAAADAQGDDALRCAMDVALEATEKRPPKQPADILACPMMTITRGWFGEPVPSIQPVAVDGNPKGELTVTLASQGGDWDIMLLEPSGRPLWWGSARKRLKTANVVGSHTETLALPSIAQGTYSIIAVPRTGKAGDTLDLVIKGLGTNKRISVKAPRSTAFEAAQVDYSVRR